MVFEYELGENLLKLKNELESGNYRHGNYCHFTVCDSKKRHIKAAPFRDRIIHHAVCNIIEPIFDKGFIYDSYACRINKGTHKAIKRLQSFIRTAGELTAKSYCLKCDISKYFDSVDQNILLKLVEKKIQDTKVLNLVKMIIYSDNRETRKGIPIGNLTSQLFANIYLNELDQFVKRKLQVKEYIRYMDDFLILDCDKKKLSKIKKEILEFLKERLKLELHPKKTSVFPTDKGIDFLGYQIFRNYRLLRKSTVKRFVKRTRKYKKMVECKLLEQDKFDRATISWLAYAKFGNSWRLREKLWNSITRP